MGLLGVVKEDGLVIEKWSFFPILFYEFVPTSSATMLKVIFIVLTKIFEVFLIYDWASWLLEL